MADYAWVIKSKHKSNDIGTYDYWNNEDGWTEHLASASLFPSDIDMDLIMFPHPQQSRWVKIKEVMM